MNCTLAEVKYRGHLLVSSCKPAVCYQIPSCLNPADYNPDPHSTETLKIHFLVTCKKQNFVPRKTAFTLSVSMYLHVFQNCKKNTRKFRATLIKYHLFACATSTNLKLVR